MLHCLILYNLGYSVTLPFFRRTNSLHLPILHGMQFNWDHSINVAKAISDLSDRRFVMIAKIVESSAYLVNGVFSSSLNYKSLRNTLKRYGPLTLPRIVPLLTALHSLVIPL